MRLFRIDDAGKLQYSENVLGIGAFFDLWDRDLSPNKENAIKELTFVYYITSMNKDNSFRLYGRKERVNIVSELVFGKYVDYSKDKLITRAIDAMLTIDKSHSKDFLRDIISNIDKLRNFLSAVDLDERDANNKLIHNPKQYSEILSKQTTLLKELKSAMEMVDNEDDGEESRIRGGAEDELEFE